MEADQFPAEEVLVPAIDRIAEKAFERVAADQIEERLAAIGNRGAGQFALLHAGDHRVERGGGHRRDVTDFGERRPIGRQMPGMEGRQRAIEKDMRASFDRSARRAVRRDHPRHQRFDRSDLGTRQALWLIAGERLRHSPAPRRHRQAEAQPLLDEAAPRAFQTIPSQSLPGGLQICRCCIPLAVTPGLTRGPAKSPRRKKKRTLSLYIAREASPTE